MTTCPDELSIPSRENVVSLSLGSISVIRLIGRFFGLSLGSVLLLDVAGLAKLASRSRAVAIAFVLGTFFVVFQGAEWVALLNQGLTLVSSQHGSFFYLIVGAHALHVVAGFLILLYTYRKLSHDDLDKFTFWPAQIFWYFVVGVWPILYWQVYL